jgi:uncharacterized small protein (DUF1192 family)
MGDHSEEAIRDDTLEKTTPAESGSARELDQRVAALSEEVRRLRELLEKLRLSQYVQAILNGRRTAWLSFLNGILGGLGGTIGATLALALLIYLLTRLELVPHIGRFVAEIAKVVQHQKP